MKVVDVAEFYARKGGGIRTYVDQKLAHGAALGHEVVVIAPGPESFDEPRMGGRIVWVKSPTWPVDSRYYLLWNRRAVHRILDRENPDVLEGSSPWLGGWTAAKWPGDCLKSFVFHSDPVAMFPQPILGPTLGEERVERMFSWYWSYLRNLAGHFDSVVVAGDWLARKLESRGIQKAKSVPFGIDKAAFGPHRADSEIRRGLCRACGVSENATLFVNLSRMFPEKRLGTILRAFAQLRLARPEQEFGLVIFGDGPLQKWVRRKASEIPGVHLAGQITDRSMIATCLASSDMMLHGSAAETYGFALAEGICSGLPLIAPNQGGAYDLALSSYSETYQPGNVGACTTALLELLDRRCKKGPALNEALKEASRIKVRSISEHFDDLFSHYEDLLTGAATKSPGGQPKPGVVTP